MPSRRIKARDQKGKFKILIIKCLTYLCVRYLCPKYELINRDVFLALLFFRRGMHNVNAFTAYQRSTRVLSLTLNPECAVGNTPAQYWEPLRDPFAFKHASSLPPWNYCAGCWFSRSFIISETSIALKFIYSKKVTKLQSN